MREQFLALLHSADCADAHFEAELIGERPCGVNVPERAEEELLERCGKAVAERYFIYN